LKHKAKRGAAETRQQPLQQRTLPTHPPPQNKQTPNAPKKQRPASPLIIIKTLEKRTIAQRDWIGSMTLELALHASAKRVVLL
jgi:hypothetical protein